MKYSKVEIVSFCILGIALGFTIAVLAEEHHWRREQSKWLSESLVMANQVAESNHRANTLEAELMAVEMVSNVWLHQPTNTTTIAVTNLHIISYGQ